MREYKERQALCAFPCKVSLSLKVPKFQTATALQRLQIELLRPRVEKDVGSHEVA